MSTNSGSEGAVANRSDFYVEEGCGGSCGVPQPIAPELVGWKEEAELLWCYCIR